MRMRHWRLGREGHAVIEAKPALMEWRRITASDSPRLYRGTRICNTNSILKHGILPGRATTSGRSVIFFRAVLTPSSKRRAWAAGDPRDEWDSREGDYDSDENIRTALEGYEFYGEVAEVVDMNMACMGGCQSSISESNVILCKDKIP